MALHQWLGAILVTSVLIVGCGKPPQPGGTTAATTTTTGSAPATTAPEAPAQETPTATETASETPATPAADETAAPDSGGTPVASAGGEDDYANAEGLTGYEEVAALTPPPSSPEAIARGKELYAGAGNCVSCHGAEGKGDGPAGQALDPAPRDLHAKADYKYGTGDRGVYRTIFYGVDGTGMAPLEGVLTPEQVWDVVHYVHTLQGT